MEKPAQALASYPSTSIGVQLNGNDEIMEYVAFLENELERMMLQASMSKQKHHKQNSHSKKEIMKESQMLKNFEDCTRCLAYDTKNNFFHFGGLLEDGRKREKVLKDKVHDLELQLDMKNDLLNHRWRRHERVEENLKKENATLKRKATLGWILGCLSEAHMSSKSNGGANHLLYMIRDILRNFTTESTNPSLTNAPMEVKLEYVEKEIQSIIQGLTKSKTDNSSPPSTNKQGLTKSKTDNSSPPSTNKRIGDDANKDTNSCYIVTVKEGGSSNDEERVGEYEVDEVSSNADKVQQQEKGVERKNETNESVQNEMKQILGRIEASMEILLQQHLQQESTSNQPPQSTTIEPQPQVLERSLGDFASTLGKSTSKHCKNKATKNNSSHSKHTSSKTKPFYYQASTN